MGRRDFHFIVGKPKSKGEGRGRRTINTAPEHGTESSHQQTPCSSHALRHSSNGDRGMRAAGARQAASKSREREGGGRGEAHSAWMWLMEAGAWEVAVSAGSPPLHSHRGHTQSSPDECECERKKAEESNGWMWLVRAKGGEWSIHTTTQCVVSQHSNSSRGLHTPLLGTGCGRCRGVDARHASTPRVVHTVACTQRVIVVVMAPGCLP